jgi:hypothetical protein
MSEDSLSALFDEGSENNLEENDNVRVRERMEEVEVKVHQKKMEGECCGENSNCNRISAKSTKPLPPKVVKYSIQFENEIDRVITHNSVLYLLIS